VPTSEDEDPLGLADAALHEVTTAADREFAGPAGWTPPTHRTEDDAFAHVLVDEAQDLTPMQWRMVGRRGRSATWTIVGDPAQSSWPHPADAERARGEALSSPSGRPKPVHAFHLSKNYRNSSEIYAFAADYARRVGLGADLPEAVRSTGVDPEERVVDDLHAGLDRALADLVDAVEGTIGIVVPATRRPDVVDWLAGSRHGALAVGADARIAVLTGLDTKGLGSDGIVVVEPQEVEDESPPGRATLYVVLPRATQRLITLARA